MRLLFGVTFFVAVALSVPLNRALAEPANALLVECADNGNVLSCVSYLLGVWDGAVSISGLSGRKYLCPPGPVNGAQMRLLFNKYAKDHPEQISYDASAVALASFISAFPCNKGADSQSEKR